jgi:hypothetical protein
VLWPFGDDLVFALELYGGVAEGFLVAEFTVPELAAQPQIPVLGEVLRLGEALLFGADAVVSATEERRALPKATTVTFVDVKAATHQFVIYCHIGLLAREAGKVCNLCKECVRVFRALKLALSDHSVLKIMVKVNALFLYRHAFKSAASTIPPGGQPERL